MRLNPAAFNGWMANIGQQFTWSKAFRCPNVNPNTGAAIPGCQVCFGRGWFWPNSVAAIAGAAGQKVQQAWAQNGLYEAGDVVLTIPENSPIYDAGQMDRLMQINTSEQFATILSAGTNDRVLSPVLSISSVFWLNAGNTATIQGIIPSIDSSGNLTWPAGGGPPEGTSYTVQGSRTQEFFIFMDYPQERREHQGARLPKRLVARRFDLFGR